MNIIQNKPAIALKFGQYDAYNAGDQWGCNCGPAALAAILGLTLDEVRSIVEKVGFASRGYMNITMMRDCVAPRISLAHVCGKTDPAACFAFRGLVRIQWGGPWIIKGKSAKWAATATHWVASWKLGGSHFIFDVNGGLMLYENWLADVVPAITASIKRCDGSWYPTHSWEIVK